MFTYLKVKNYKSLVDLDVDFTYKSKPEKLVLVYGENGIGKSNLATIFYTLHEFMDTREAKNRIQEIFENELLKKIPEKEIINSLKENWKDTEQIIKSVKTISSKENMSFEFGFKIKGKNGRYYLETNDESIVAEKLEFVLNKNQTVLFDISNDTRKINDKLFKNSDYKKEFVSLIEKYWGKHSLFSILSYEINDKAKNYVIKNIAVELKNVFKFFKKLNINVKEGNSIEKGIITNTRRIFRLDKGNISFDLKEELLLNEKILKAFFTELYSDVKDVFYKLEENENDIEYELYLKKMTYGKLIEIPFRIESTGTQRLLNLVPYIISSMEGGVVIIDEFDTGIHDLLVEKLLDGLKDSIKGQLILTTHNTILLECDACKKGAYIFNSDYQGKKELIPIRKFENKIHPNLNLRKRYLSGLYGGIPMADSVDFDDIFEVSEEE